jgi:hypothetical protein
MQRGRHPEPRFERTRTVTLLLGILHAVVACNLTHAFLVCEAEDAIGHYNKRISVLCVSYSARSHLSRRGTGLRCPRHACTSVCDRAARNFLSPAL